MDLCSGVVAMEKGYMVVEERRLGEWLSLWSQKDAVWSLRGCCGACDASGACMYWIWRRLSLLLDLTRRSGLMAAPHVCRPQCHVGKHMCTSVMHGLRGSWTLSSPFTIKGMGKAKGGIKALPITHYVVACRPASIGGR